MEATNLQKIHYLDGIRGIASFIVYLHHFGTIYFPFIYYRDTNLIHFNFEKTFAYTPVYLVVDGPYMVFIFFILSTIVLSRSFLMSRSLESNLAVQFIKRYIRLVIPAAVSIFLAFILLHLGAFNTTLVAQTTNSYAWIGNFYKVVPDFFSTLYQAFIGSMFFSTNYLNPMLWTISYELLGSFFVFIYWHILKNKPRTRVLLLPILFLLTWGTPYVAFVFGLVIYEAVFIKHLTINKLTSVLLFTFSYIVWDIGQNGLITRLISFSIISAKPITDLAEQSNFYTISAGLLILGIINSNILIRLLSTKIFQGLGKISFSLYLIHGIILCSLSTKVFMKVLQLTTSNYFISSVITLVVTTILLLLCSYLYYLYVDKNAINVAKWVYNRFKGLE